MKALINWLATVISAAVAVVSFIANNSPSDIEQKANSWLNIPIVKEIPAGVTKIAARSDVLAVSFFALGLLLGIFATKWYMQRDNEPWWVVLGRDLKILKQEIKWERDFSIAEAKINVMKAKMSKRRFDFPRIEDGFDTIDKWMPYLNHVGNHLQAGQVEEARNAATNLTQKQN
ncbi:MAG: hypothetical protein K2P80_02135 [Beijerinckiaceae bacterium]|nr:hypothetical protein [Beijerinckiaceae bacterium]